MAGKTYESLFKQKTEVYVKWVASTYAVEHIVVGIVSAVVLYILALSPLGSIYTMFGLFKPAFRFALPGLLAICIAGLSAMIDPGSKPLLLYLWGAVSYFFKPKVFIGGHRRMKRWKGEKAKVQQQMVYTVSEGSIPVPAVLIGQKGKLHLRAALEAERVRNGIILRRASSKGRRSTIRLPYGRITITNEGRGRIGYRR